MHLVVCVARVLISNMWMWNIELKGMWCMRQCKSVCNTGNPGSIPWSGSFPGEGHINPLQYSCLENPMDRGAWQVKVHAVAESDTTEWIILFFFYFSSVQFSRSVVSDSLWPHELQHARPPCPSPTPGVHSNSCPSSRWCHPAISSSVIPFSSRPQSLPASESFPMSQLFAWGGQSTGVSALVSFLPKNTQDWSPSEWTGWISLQSKGLSRVFSNTTVQKHQFFSAQLSSQSDSHIHTWLLEKSYGMYLKKKVLYCMNYI